MPKKPSTYKKGADLGGTTEATGSWLKKYPLAGTGTFTAIDVSTGKISWQKKEPVAMIGGATTTAGGLVFVGVSGKGLFQALDAKTGKVLRQQGLGAHRRRRERLLGRRQGIRADLFRRHVHRRPRLGRHRETVSRDLHGVFPRLTGSEQPARSTTNRAGASERHNERSSDASHQSHAAHHRCDPRACGGADIAASRANTLTGTDGPGFTSR